MQNRANPGPMAQRMQHLRAAMEGSEHGALTRFARRIGVSVPRWHNVENGMPVSFALANILVQKFPGLTLDWIYYGKPDGLTVAMAARLGLDNRSDSATA